MKHPSGLVSPQSNCRTSLWTVATPLNTECGVGEAKAIVTESTSARLQAGRVIAAWCLFYPLFALDCVAEQPWDDVPCKDSHGCSVKACSPRSRAQSKRIMRWRWSWEWPGVKTHAPSSRRKSRSPWNELREDRKIGGRSPLETEAFETRRNRAIFMVATDGDRRAETGSGIAGHESGCYIAAIFRQPMVWSNTKRSSGRGGHMGRSK